MILEDLFELAAKTTPSTPAYLEHLLRLLGKKRFFIYFGQVLVEVLI